MLLSLWEFVMEWLKTNTVLSLHSEKLLRGPQMCLVWNIGSQLGDRDCCWESKCLRSHFEPLRPRLVPQTTSKPILTPLISTRVKNVRLEARHFALGCFPNLSFWESPSQLCLLWVVTYLWVGHRHWSSLEAFLATTPSSLFSGWSPGGSEVLMMAAYLPHILPSWTFHSNVTHKVSSWSWMAL